VAVPSPHVSGDDLVARARRWLHADPDPDTRAELAALLDPPDLDGLAERFDGHLQFGTAGLRAEMGAGPRRMNRIVVRRAAAGLIDHLGPGSKVVIGHDARHKSDVFARDTARVVAGAGGVAIVFTGAVPTPLVAFAVRELEADAGVVCTASHNPAHDNGFKVYLADGVQMNAPVDRQIAAAIEDLGDGEVVLAELDDPGIWTAGPEVAESYLARAVDLVTPGPYDITIVYTPLHGVGAALTESLFVRAGFAPLHTVEQQAQPDADFPTVDYPNPEEPGALDLALAEARRRGADLVLAHDPDADRLGVAVPFEGEWRLLTGDQIGALLADHLLRRSDDPDRLVVDTVVSSGLLGRLADEHGVHHLQTLTGFKWVMRPVVDHPDWPLVFAYEEALGFAVSDLVRDKDGMTAALVFAELVARARAEGESVWDRLERIARRHGLFATRTWSVRLDGPGAEQRVGALMARLRSAVPERLASLAVERVVDLRHGDSLPPTDAIALYLEEDARIVIRPSGTEPKVKAYARVVVPVGVQPDSFGMAEAQAERRLGDLRRAVTTLLST
jgi:phosphomannomutase